MSLNHEMEMMVRYFFAEGPRPDFALLNLLLTQNRQGLPPPASKDAVAALPEIKPTESHNKECPICLKDFIDTDPIILMPCKHSFHKKCIMLWLEKTNSCPICRYELPTDDEDYELMKKEKKREKEREKEIEQLHNSMYT